MNEIGVVRIEAARPLIFDSYAQNRITGSFILIDSASNATVAAGLISGPASAHAAAPAEDPFTWRIENGPLVFSIGVSRDTTEPQPIHDPQALEALRLLLERLGISNK